ncbi:MAG: hypothetical protein IPM66_23740 [Acidobacteriota bacterium]|nr:MAG: hypothetical protein IPM66_23740 [Acidobacteriota bacterium]
MSTTINPEMRELQQKVEEMRINLARTQGEIEIIRQNSERNDRQTIKQFVIFTVTMAITVATTLIGTSVFQTDALRREMSAKFEVVDQRFDAVDQRMSTLEKRMDRMDLRMDRMEVSLNEIKSRLGIRTK